MIQHYTCEVLFSRGQLSVDSKPLIFALVFVSMWLCEKLYNVLGVFVTFSIFLGPFLNNFWYFYYMILYSKAKASKTLALNMQYLLSVLFVLSDNIHTYKLKLILSFVVNLCFILSSEKVDRFVMLILWHKHLSSFSTYTFWLLYSTAKWLTKFKHFLYKRKRFDFLFMNYTPTFTSFISQKRKKKISHCSKNSYLIC